MGDDMKAVAGTRTSRNSLGERSQQQVSQPQSNPDVPDVLHATDQAAAAQFQSNDKGSVLTQVSPNEKSNVQRIAVLEQQLGHTHTKLNTVIGDLQQKCTTLQQQLDEEVAKGRRAFEHNVQLQECIEAMKRRMAAMESMMDSNNAAIASHAALVSDLQDKVRGLEDGTSSAAVAQLVETDKVASDVKGAHSMIHDIKDAIKSLRLQHEEQCNKAEAEVHALQQRLNMQIADIKAVMGSVDTVKSYKDALNKAEQSAVEVKSLVAEMQQKQAVHAHPSTHVPAKPSGNSVLLRAPKGELFPASVKASYTARALHLNANIFFQIFTTRRAVQPPRGCGCEASAVPK
jgi:chromosome segregation ATPase